MDDDLDEDVKKDELKFLGGNKVFEDKKKSVINKNDEIIKATLICSAGKNLIK